MKRIFTKQFSGIVTCVGGVPADRGANALESWLAQEDIEVIGAEIAVVSTAPSQNDGFAFASVEVSQVGIFAQDGAILMAAAAEGWNTAPAGIDQVNGHAFIAFPSGLAVPVKEEGYLYINWQGGAKTAGDSTFSYRVCVYYTKRGA